MLGYRDYNLRFPNVKIYIDRETLARGSHCQTLHHALELDSNISTYRQCAFKTYRISLRAVLALSLSLPSGYIITTIVVS
jgi:hypothetical protein